LAPSFTRRVLLAVSFPTLRWSAWTIAIPFRPRSGAGHRCHHRWRSGETSQPGVRTLASVLLPDPVRMLLRFVASDPLPQGRHRTSRSRSLALRHGSCLLSLLLLFLLSRTTSFSRPPDVRILLRFRGHRQPSGAFQSNRSIRDNPFRFHVPGCDT
jgi:hypothetical protein